MLKTTLHIYPVQRLYPAYPHFAACELRPLFTVIHHNIVPPPQPQSLPPEQPTTATKLRIPLASAFNITTHYNIRHVCTCNTSSPLLSEHSPRAILIGITLKSQYRC